MTENETRAVVEEWLTELILELNSEQREGLRKALKENSDEELSDRQTFVYGFLKEFKNDWGYFPKELFEKEN